MNPIIKAKWVAALRSGEYKQGMGSLRSSSNEFCCLGVLCDLHSKEIDCKWTDGEWVEGVMTYLGKSGLPPRVVIEWAELVDMSVIIAGEVMLLDEHNDSEATFAQIAQAIEEQL